MITWLLKEVNKIEMLVLNSVSIPSAWISGNVRLESTENMWSKSVLLKV